MPTATILSVTQKEEDDGWGDTGDFSSNKKPSELDELISLQQERDRASSGRRISSPSLSPVYSNSSTQEPDRDLFIPIFALISMAGLFGSYGYEMLRLYSRGELYLPWNN
ncbi:MAG: hypothetical protein IBX70_13640 [Clostridia bacterium]|nr:hypothetical protein [Clostridia bacterium]